MTDAIMEFTNMSKKRRSNKDSDSRKETVESTLVGDRFSMDKVVTILNNIKKVDDYTMFQVLNELHKPDSRAAFIMLRLDRRRGWMDLVSSLMQGTWLRKEGEFRLLFMGLKLLLLFLCSIMLIITRTIFCFIGCMVQWGDILVH